MPRPPNRRKPPTHVFRLPISQWKVVAVGSFLFRTEQEFPLTTSGTGEGKQTGSPELAEALSFPAETEKPLFGQKKLMLVGRNNRRDLAMASGQIQEASLFPWAQHYPLPRDIKLPRYTDRGILPYLSSPSQPARRPRDRAYTSLACTSREHGSPQGLITQAN